MTPENIKRAREELTEMGVIVDSGRKRRARSGELQTVWVTRETAARMGLKLPPLKVTREEAEASRDAVPTRRSASTACSMYTIERSGLAAAPAQRRRP